MTRETLAEGEKPLLWVGSSKKDLLRFPQAVREHLSVALGVAQFGGKHPGAKPWKGDGGGVFEVVEDHHGDTFRAVYTVRFAAAVYVLHAFQKKSKTGKATDKTDLEMVIRRMKLAQEDYERRKRESDNG